MARTFKTQFMQIQPWICVTALALGWVGLFISTMIGSGKTHHLMPLAFLASTLTLALGFGLAVPSITAIDPSPRTRFWGRTLTCVGAVSTVYLGTYVNFEGGIWILYTTGWAFSILGIAGAYYAARLEAKQLKAVEPAPEAARGRKAS